METDSEDPPTENNESEYPARLVTWEYIYDLCRDVANEVKASQFEPDVVVALARGGWFAGRCLCDFLGLDDLTSLKMEHYVGTAEKSGEPTIRYPMPDGSVEGKQVLVIDDIADTGGSIRRAEEYVTDRNAGEVRTATLQLLGTSEAEPDYIGERLEEWVWVVYPWNFIEDMADLVGGVIDRSDRETVEREEIRHLLRTYHGIDRIEMEVAQPDRLDEVLAEMVRRGLLDQAGPDEWRPVRSD